MSHRIRGSASGGIGLAQERKVRCKCRRITSLSSAKMLRCSAAESLSEVPFAAARAPIHPETCRCEPCCHATMRANCCPWLPFRAGFLCHVGRPLSAPLGPFCSLQGGGGVAGRPLAPGHPTQAGLPGSFPIIRRSAYLNRKVPPRNAHGKGLLRSCNPLLGAVPG